MSSVLSFQLVAAELVPAKGVSVLYVNGHEAEKKIGVNTLNQGYNQIVVRMDKEVGRGSSNNVFTSKPYVISFDVSGDVVKVNHPTARSIGEAEKAFSLTEPKWIIEHDGQPLDYSQELLPGKQGLFPYMNLDALMSEYNNGKGLYFDNGQLIDKPVVVKALPVAAGSSAIAASSTSQAAKQLVESSNIDQLKAWYLKSSNEERKAFRRWMIDQE